MSWQTMLADLALILFMVTAMAMGQPAAKPGHTILPTTSPQPKGSGRQALALWRASGNAPTLKAWLATQPTDPRQQLTITALYRSGYRTRAVNLANQLSVSAGALGERASIIVEPRGVSGVSGAPVELAARLGFDRPDLN